MKSVFKLLFHNTQIRIKVEFIILSPRSFDDVCEYLLRYKAVPLNVNYIYKPITDARLVANFIRLLVFQDDP